MPEQDYEILTNSKYYLEITLQNSPTVIDGYFMECQGFKRSQEVISICEVLPTTPDSGKSKVGQILRTKLPGNSKCENIILKRGLCISDTLWKWFRSVEVGKWGTQRFDGDLTLYGQGANMCARFRFLRAWPVSYKISDLKSADSNFELEELELAVEEFIRVQPDGKEINL